MDVFEEDPAEFVEIFNPGPDGEHQGHINNGQPDLV
jgi:hypothetical protein